MATTTNYGWGTPDDTDLVKDGALAIRDLGQDIDTTTKALNPETTTGDIAYRSATANTNTRLALGTAGQVLRVNSGATAPEWATPVSGKVLQIVQGTYATQATSTSTTFADTGLSASITPSSASNKVLVIVHQSGVGHTGENFAATKLRLLRDSTSIITFENEAGKIIGGGSNDVTIGTQSTTYLDTPATTSAITYKTQFANLDPAGTAYVIRNSTSTSTITLLEIGA